MLERGHEATSDAVSDPIPEGAIAVVGMGLRFAGAVTPAQFWDNLRQGVRSIRDYSVDELMAAGVDADQLDDSSYVRSGAPITGFDLFDAEFFGFSPKEAAIMDPQHRKFLECCWEALEDSTHPPAKFDGPIGVFGGCGMNSYFIFNLLRNPAVRDSVGMFLLRHTGNDKDFLTTRVSYCFDLKGPSVSVQTACSTSLVAIHSAAQSLLAGECDMAIAGGTTIELPHGQGYEFTPGEILSPDGHCRAFDDRSEGTVFGSGSGAVVLRRLEDAIADGDRIYSVIRGSAVNNDGASKAGYLAPSIDQQAAVAAEAMAIANVTADTIGFVAAHGTGTPIGDPIEVAALTQAFRETSGKTQTCVLGSIKPNIGHTDTAAGVASFIAASLAIHHGEIPPSVDFREPNSAIDFDSSPFVVSSVARNWDPSQAVRRAMVHSLGVGGTNANVILESPPRRVVLGRKSVTPQILTISAKSAESLDEQVIRLADFIEESADLSLSDVAYTLRVGRDDFAYRRVVVARDRAEAAARLRGDELGYQSTVKSNPKSSSATFLFPGGGAQYLGMGKGLYDHEPVFRSVIDLGCETLKPLIGCDLRELVFADSDASQQFERPSIQLPAIFLWEVAIAKLWIASGVQPTAMLGHSMGENTAAYMAGVMSFDDALQLIVLRGQLLEKVPPSGMMTVDRASEQVADHLCGEVDIAVINGPSMCVVSGADEAMARFAVRMKAIGVETKRIPIRIAAHSRLLDDVLPEFRSFLQSISLHAPAIPFVSNRTGTWITDDEATSPEYWCEQLRRTVRFSSCIETLAQNESRVLLEAGPGKVLSAIVKQHPAVHASRTVLSSLRHPDQNVADEDYFLATLGSLWAAGFPVDLTNRMAEQLPSRIMLPTYAFEQDRYWVDATEDPDAAKVVKKPSLTRRDNLQHWFSVPSWESFNAQADSLNVDSASKWLVFVDDAGVGDAAVEILRAASAQVTTVHVADVFQRTTASRYGIVPELGASEYRSLIDSLADDDRLPDHVLFMWPVTADQSFRPGSTFLMRTFEEGLYGLTYLIAALADRLGDVSCRITLTTCGAQSVHGETVAHPEKATALGPIEVAAREYPNLKTLAIDVDLGGHVRVDLAEASKAVIAQTLLPHDSGSQVLAIRNGNTYRRILMDSSAGDDRGTENLIRQRGTYLITGGLGGIGLQMAAMLARKNANLVLISRRGLDESDGKRTRQVETLRNAGACVMVCAADVADQWQMDSTVEQAIKQFGKIDGVLHAAGEIDDQLIATLSSDSIERVLSAKVHGTRVLQSIFRESNLDFFLVCASTSTFLTPAGQTAYVAANHFLNAFTHSNPFPESNTHVIAINWGVWKSVGMGAGVHRKLIGATDGDFVRREPSADSLFEHISVDESNGVVRYHTTRQAIGDWELNEHRTPNGDAVIPGTAYIQWMVAAASESLGHCSFRLCNVAFVAPCIVADQELAELRVCWLPSTDSRSQLGSIEVQSRLRDDQVWLTHSIAEVEAVADSRTVTLDSLVGPPSETIPRSIANTTRQCELLNFGPRWNSYRTIQYFGDCATAELELPAEFASDLNDHALHPALLDMATGFGLPLVSDYNQSSSLYVPVGYGSVRVLRPMPAVVRSTIRLASNRTGVGSDIAFDITIQDEQGHVVAEIQRLQMRAVDASRFGSPVVRQRQTTNKPVLSDSQKLFAEVYRLGISPQEGSQAIERIVENASDGCVYVSPVDLSDLRSRFDELDQPKQDSGFKFARPRSAEALKLPTTPTEKWLAQLWQDLLGIEDIGVNDSFLDLGGHSLLAVRFFSRLRTQRGVDLPLSTLFDSPTIGKLAVLIDGDQDSSDAKSDAAIATTPAYRFVVPLHVPAATEKPPLFIVGGMFGNVLNLRYLAKRLGDDQPVYGIQAKGLIGDDAPHRTFADMARDYLHEVRLIQPEGPYFIGGFSGGGVSAYEMAQQLTAAGQEVAFVALLDTPAVHHMKLTWIDKAKIHFDQIRGRRFGYFAQLLRDRKDWSDRQSETDRRRSRHASAEATHDGVEFRSSVIGDAFMDAHACYQTLPYDGVVHLFRPPLAIAHDLPGSRRINSDRQFMDEMNHWQPWVRGGIKLFEVAGDHDSMVLEPHVRTLASMMKRQLELAQSAAKNVLAPASNFDLAHSSHSHQPELV
ncbi:type I polyketide synthase [Rubripirellula reticaptiva]|uniref:Phenolphthiocerol/phthiocerol polyketide synthase subunit E n=1 Tax=Rubripirellula reticaptiva TaxID=2528013 RepID=A0A5C6F734_9BACT|nr:type I polyketide synthase [Rubripirellula reticaptiva]TWU57198.1 Phthiocerol synthesis polyketide synthase type I PpsE [Rubripirellula reticaptiva]